MIERRAEDDWNEHWDRYAAAASLNPAQSMRHHAILAALRNGPWPTERLLDVGSGQGDFLTRAVEAGAGRAYAGFELSSRGIEIARAKLPTAEFLQVNLYAPREESSRFHGWATAAVCSDVIEHVDEPIAFLRALHRYLADGAKLVLTVPGGPMSKFDRHIGHRRHYTGALARAVLSEAGFVTEGTRLVGFPFFNLYRLLVILRGDKLVDDVKSDGQMAASSLARVIMKAFKVLFRFNLRNFPLGWQVVVTARKI